MVKSVGGLGIEGQAICQGNVSGNRHVIKQKETNYMNGSANKSMRSSGLKSRKGFRLI